MEKAGQSDVRRLPVVSETKIFGFAIQRQLRRKMDWLDGGVGRVEGSGSAKVVAIGEEGENTKSYKCEPADRKSPPNQGFFTHLGRRATRFTSLH